MEQAHDLFKWISAAACEILAPAPLWLSGTWDFLALEVLVALEDGSKDLEQSRSQASCRPHSFPHDLSQNHYDSFLVTALRNKNLSSVSTFRLSVSWRRTSSWARGSTPGLIPLIIFIFLSVVRQDDIPGRLGSADPRGDSNLTVHGGASRAFWWLLLLFLC